MTKTPRENAIELKKKFPEAPYEEGRMVYISSAWLKTCDLYQRFLNFYSQMTSGDKNFFVASLDYRVGIDAGLFTEENMMLEKNDPEMTLDKWAYEQTYAPYIRNYIMKIQQTQGLLIYLGGIDMWTKDKE